jgi:AraC family transcriptional regulator of adaptative response / DNA-3-methyladenine glycosylase II
MDLDASRCYRAILARDARFDGRFFVAVRTTGVYCRPVCPAPTPKRSNVMFFPCAAAAEAAGFRPCRRCRPETSPGAPAWNGTAAVVSRALRLIADGALDEGESEALVRKTALAEGGSRPTGATAYSRLAARLGLGERQLRRLFLKHLGASPAGIARARRVHFAKRLVDETELSMTEIAVCAGFRSIRQFNHAIRATFGRSPSAMRRKQRSVAVDREGRLVLRLAYRPPLDWRSLLDFFRRRAIPGVESVEGGTYRRTIECDGEAAVIEIVPIAGQPRLELRVDRGVVGSLFAIVERVRRMFDLNADPLQIAATFSRDPLLGERMSRRPGLRVPGAWNGFELAVRAILGQQVTVRAATTLAGRLVQRFGVPIESPEHGLTHVFPRPEVLARADLGGIGLTTARAATIRGLARAVASGGLRLEAPLGLDEAVVRLAALPGIGEWTAQYIALRAFGEPDAFPAADLGLRRSLANGKGVPSAKSVVELSQAWRPWRSYAAIHLWTADQRKEQQS